jgi:hypothetical protein
MERFVNTYSDGMDQDSSLNKFDPKHYFEAWNLSPLTDEGLANAAMNSIKSTLYHASASWGEYVYVIGHCRVRNYLVLFLTVSIDEDPGGDDPSSYGYIASIDLSSSSLTQTNVWTKEGLNFTTAHPIFDQTVGRYERADVIKVWWTDNFNVLRGVNIMDPPDDISDIEIVGDVDMSQPTISSIGNGSINVGMIQYSYQLYNLGGSETIFSPVSPLYNIVEESYYRANTSGFKGGDSRDDQDASINSGKSVTVSISNLDTNYDRIRVVAIHYDTVDSTPEIGIVTERSFTSSITVLDPGTYTLGSYSIEEFRTLGGELFTCKTIEEKDNMLFAGNISYQNFDFDWDARAYRFNSGANCEIRDKSWNATALSVSGSWPNITITDSATSQPIPESHDALCRYNVYYNAPESDWGVPEAAPYSDLDSNAYRFQTDASTVGGEGENVKYEFITRDIILATRELTQPHRAIASPSGSIGSYTNYANPYNAANYTGNKRDEIYRYALIATDNKGRNSYAKWIADIRFPISLGADSLAVVNHWDGTIKGRALGIKFTVDTSGFPSNITGFRIVRVKREQQDKTILFSGLLSATKSNEIDSQTVGGPQLIPRYKHNYTVNNECPWTPFQQVCEIISPEVNIYKNQSYQTDDYIKVSGVLSERVFHSAHNEVSLYGTDTDTHNLGWTHGGEMYVRYDRCYGVSANLRSNIEQGVVQGPVHFVDATANIASEFNDHSHYACARDDGTGNKAESGTRFVIGTGFYPISQSALAAYNDDWSTYVVDYKRKNITSIYGGLGYVERQGNEYIPCGDFVPITPGGEYETEVYGGDTYITMFGHRFSMFNINDYDSDDNPDIPTNEVFACHVTFPVETTVNTEYTHGPKGNDFSSIEENLSYLHELAGDYILTYNLPEDRYYNQAEDMYLYNSVFSQQNTTQIYLPKPQDFVEVTEYDNLILHSNVKSNNEQVDSYFKFLPDNAIEIDTGYGPINKLMRFKNYMIFFQDRGVGTISVNERQLVPVENNAALELGHGGVLDRYDMIATGVGAQTPETVVQTENAFYWVDMYKKAMYRYSGKAEDITIVKGMMSFMQNLPDVVGNRVCKDTSFVLLGEHSKFKQVFLSVYDDNDTANSYMLVYNELTDAFTHLLRIDVPYMIPAGERMVHFKNYYNCYTMYEGTNYNNFHGTYFDGQISYIVNPNSNIVNTYHNFEISSEVYGNTGANLVDRTMDTVRVRNDYQDTGVVTITPGTNARRLLRTWRMHLPRDNSARIRDSYIRVDFTFDHSNEERIVMHDLITTYDVPAEMLIK